MSIFKKRDPGEPEQPGTEAAPNAGVEGVADARATQPAVPDQSARKTPASGFAPPFVRPGVVPPPATPVYSMRASEAAAISLEKIAQPEHSVAAQRATPRPPRVPQRPTPPPRRMTPVTFRPPRARQVFDPVAATQAGLLNLAWRWQAAGSPIRAIHAYLQILIRYPGSAGAEAAVADLVELSDKLAGTGQFHIALGIYDHLEELLA